MTNTRIPKGILQAKKMEEGYGDFRETTYAYIKSE
jgi:hypothetical protein